MSARVVRALALVAVVAVIAWRLWARGHGDAPVAPGPTVAPELVAPGAGVHVVPTALPAAAVPVHSDTVGPRPELPAPRADTSGGRTLPPPEAYAAEPRDDRWARPIEADLRKRTNALADVRADGIECKTSTCMLTLAGTPSAISAAIDALGGTKGLQLPIVLSASHVGSDGSATVTAYVRYPVRPGDPEPD